MSEIWNDPKVWFYVAGIIAQAGITWWRVGAIEKRSERNSDRISDHGERIAKIEGRLGINGNDKK